MWEEPVPSSHQQYNGSARFVGYLAYGAKDITSDPDNGYYMLYDRPTVLGLGEQYFFTDIYEYCGDEPKGALQGYCGTASNLNKQGNTTTYGGQSFDPYEGTLIFQGIKRHAIALGPKLQNPDWVSGSAQPEDMAYGTAVDVAIQMDDGNTYYIPAIITDIKAHTYPTGILQTGDSLASNSNTAKKKAPTSWNGILLKKCRKTNLQG